MGIREELNRVFQQEIESLVHVREMLSEEYVQAVEQIFACTGKVVVVGMGKSGLIARKIAATFVSTGTPATFLHAGDGIHGDVGIVQKGDIVLAISKSGETEELLTLLMYINNVGVPLISVTCYPDSTLGRNSDLVLWTPIDGEACPMDLAPTTSTTVALVVGDALAAALMKLRNFTPSDFARFHPGGLIGKQLLLTVSAVMRSGQDNPIIKKNETIANMLYYISNKRCGAVSVVDDEGRLLGLVTDYDVRKSLEIYEDIFSTGIIDVMNDNPTYIYSDELAVTAKDSMLNRRNPFLVLPVLDRDNNSVVGMIHLHDLVDKGL